MARPHSALKCKTELSKCPLFVEVGLILPYAEQKLQELLMSPITELSRSNRPNNYLLAPVGYCKHAETNGEAPVYDCAASDLRLRFLGMLKSQPRVETISDEANALTLTQTSMVWRFVDDIFVDFIDLPDGRSTFAVYSRSRVGYSDMGVNAKRIKKWLELI